MRKIDKTAAPGKDELPTLAGQNVLIFGKEVRGWFRQRREFLASVPEASHYFDDFSDAEEAFFAEFDHASVSFGLSPTTSKQTLKRWESALQHARHFYVKALNHLDRIGYWLQKERRESVQYDPKQQSIFYSDPKSGLKQEYMFSRDKKWSFLCQKVYENCRQVGSSMSVKKLYDMMANKYHLPTLESDPLVNLKRMRDTVASANRWAKKNGLPKLLSCSSQQVTRLL